jgi:ATP-dependent Clp protease ATP-binding subunit ClpC
MSDVLKPALARGELRVIGATTWQEYEKYIKPDQALERRLQPVLIDEPTAAQAVAILKTLRPVYEKFHSVKITDEALRAAVDISKKKIKNRQLPDKAIDLMDEAAAKVSIELHQCHKTAIGLVHAAAQACDETVNAKDIEEVAEPWITHINHQP